MPYAPRRGCSYGNCSQLAVPGSRYCEEHKKLIDQHYEHFTRGYKTGIRYGSQWRKIRSRYVKKHPLCEMCLREGRFTEVDEVHHILPLADGGTNDESNLMSLCRSCHERIHRDRGDRQGR